MAAVDLLAVAVQVEEAGEPPKRLPSKAQRASARQRDYERIEPIVFVLAENVGEAAFTVTNVHRAAVAAGIIMGDEVTLGQHWAPYVARSLPHLASAAQPDHAADLSGQHERQAAIRPLRSQRQAHVEYVLPAFARAISAQRV